jgi:hypothetical protein
MDLGGATRELAPLKLKKPRGFKLKAKTIHKFLAPPVDPAIELLDEDLDKDPHLFDHNMFYHLLGLSNLRKVMWPKLEILNLTVTSEAPDDSYVRESSVDQSTPWQQGNN